MLPIPKNKTIGHTYHWLNERERLTNFYQERPFYGSPLAKTFYEQVKKIIPSLIQVSICGPIVSIVTYKQDKDKARHILFKMFNSEIKETICPFTEYATTYVINK